MTSIKILKNILLKYKKQYIAGIICLFIADAFQLSIPLVLRSFVDSLESLNIIQSDLLNYSISLLLLAIGIAVFRFFWRYFIIGSSRKVEYELRNKFFNHLQKLPPTYYDNSKTGNIMAHGTNDIEAVRMALGPGIVMIADTFFLVIAAVFLMIRTIDFKLTLLALIPFPIMAFISAKFGKVIHRRFKDVQKAFSQLSEFTQENIAGIRVIKSFVQENHQIFSFANINDHNVKMNNKLIKLWGFFLPLLMFLSGLSFMIVLGYGGILVLHGRITLGDFVAFNSYLTLLIWPMMAVGWVINLFQRGYASLERLNAIFEEKTIFDNIHNKNKKTKLDFLDYPIIFNNLSFSYYQNNSLALKNINLSINESSFTAIVGRIGSGKSTLLKLLLKLYPVEDSKIFFGKYDINKITYNNLRDNIGYVPQESFLFSTTIKNNIIFGAKNPTDQDLKKASIISEIHGTIENLPNGFNTVLGERGVTLSGGQKQRIAIARAIFKNPDLLLLDDPLSSVDSKTEESILNNLKEIKGNKTYILSSHRISTVRHADTIIYIENGNIVEKGTHKELIKKKGLYYNLYQKQLLEDTIKPKQGDYFE